MSRYGYEVVCDITESFSRRPCALCFRLEQ